MADLTHENIELTYFHFDQDETVKYLADRFMELYPNIKVTGTPYLPLVWKVPSPALFTVSARFWVSGSAFQYSETSRSSMLDRAKSWEAWFGATGHVAMFSEAFWTYQGTWATEGYEQYNLDIIPYVVPAVSEQDATANHHSIATIDFGGVTTGTKYPREAYATLS